MTKRVLTGTLLVLIVLGFFLLRTVNVNLFEILILLFSILGTIEMLRAFDAKISLSQKVIVGMFAVAFTLSYVIIKSVNVNFAILFIALFLLLALLVIDYNNVTLEGFGYSLISMVYPTVILFPMTLINYQAEHSLVALVTVFAISPLSDTLAYFVGSKIGGKKMCPTISPKKTVSGGIGGIIGGILAGIIVWAVFAKDDINILFFIILGGIGAVTTEFGDLVESVIKRKLEIKDMGNLLPGHGGIMDRIDSILYTCPVIYFAFTLL